MKLITGIPPRKDGTVIATVPATDSVPLGRYTFKPDVGGELSCMVEHGSHIAWLLDSGFYFPANEHDIDAGMDAVNHHGLVADTVVIEPVEHFGHARGKPGRKKREQ